jgi:hypothetical protein
VVGVAATSTVDHPDWTVELVAVSCRAGGRGALPVLLTGVARLARSAGARRLAVPCRLTERNVPVRLGLRQAGFAAAGRAGEVAVFARDLAAEPSYPDWITVDDRLAPPTDRPDADDQPGAGDGRPGAPGGPGVAGRPGVVGRPGAGDGGRGAP